MSVPVKRTVTIMSFFNGTALLFGAVQAIIIARTFGTDKVYDLYLLVAIIPEVITIFTQYMVIALVLPFFHRWEKEYGEAGAWRELWNVTNGVIVIYVASAAVIISAAPYIVAKVIPGGGAAEIARGALLLRVLTPIIATSLCLRVFFSVHNALGKFIFPSMTNLAQPILISASILLFAPGVGVYSIAVGALAASIVQAGILSAGIMRAGARYWRPTINPTRPAARTFFAAVLPLAAGAAADQVNTLVDRNIAVRVAEGAVSSLKYGYTIMGFAAAVFSIPLSRVSFMYFSRDAAGERKGEVTKRLERTLMQLAVFYVPASVGLFILAEPVIGFLFHGGRFDAESLNLTVEVVRAYSVGLVFLVALGMVRAAAYALQRYWFFSAIAVGAVGLTVGADLFFAAWFGHWGIALARGLVNAAWVSAVLLYLGARGDVRLTGSSAVTYVKIIAASALMGALVWWIYGLGLGIGTAGRFGYLLRLLIPAAAGVIVYAASSVFLRVEPVRELMDSLVRKLKGDAGSVA